MLLAKKKNINFMNKKIILNEILIHLYKYEKNTYLYGAWYIQIAVAVF